MTKDELVDRNASSNALGILLKHPNWLYKYPVSEDDLTTQFERSLLLAIQHFAPITTEGVSGGEILQYLNTSHPSMAANYEKCNGDKYVCQVKELASDDKIEYYFLALKKWSLIRELFSRNIDISYYFSSDVLSEEQELAMEHFEKDSLQDILSHYENILNEVRESVIANIPNTISPVDVNQLDTSDQSDEQIIEDMLLSNTLNSIVGQAKAGKSFFSYQLAFCVQNGIPFLEHPTTKKDVLVADFELKSSAIKDRFLRLKDFYGLPDAEGYKILALGKTWGTEVTHLTDVLRTVKEEKERNPSLGLVIFDCYYRFAEGEENKAEDTMKNLSLLKALTKDLTVIYVHHTTKQGSKSDAGAINSGSGSGVHGRIVDQSYILDLHNDGSVMVTNSGRDWYNVKMPCKRSETGYFILDVNEERAHLDKICSDLALRAEIKEFIGEGKSVNTVIENFKQRGVNRSILRGMNFKVDGKSNKVTN